MQYTLRDYQQDSVQATLKHFRKSNESAVIVLPTGAGKSLVIAELARLARKRILVITHVKELVEQNHEKYESFGLQAGIYSAGLNQKNTTHQVTFASIQSAARNPDAFSGEYSLIIVDECHRISFSDDEDQTNTTQYQLLIDHLKRNNPELKVLGLTATPYRLGMGWIYRKHYRGYIRSDQPRPFEHCIYELPLRYLVKKGYLTPPNLIDAPVAQYDFSALQQSRFGEFNQNEVNALLVQNQRVTRSIIDQVVGLSTERQGVMIFAATVRHAEEIFSYLPQEQSALITGATADTDRTELINAFRNRKLKFLVNVSVLTTGFDAPHVDLIAILRPTQSVSLFQQIAGRGLRLSDNKKDCLIIDYAGSGFDLYHPEVGDERPDKKSVPVQVPCPICEFANIFWGLTDSDGDIIEHYGRRCQALDTESGEQCSYRFRFRECSACNAENDIAARQCHECGELLTDPDDQLKKALKLSNAMVLRCAGVSLQKEKNKLLICYHGEQGEELKERFDLTQPAQRQHFNQTFTRRMQTSAKLSSVREIQHLWIENTEQALQLQSCFPQPDFIIARKKKHYWKVTERIFDYEGKIRKAHQM